MNRHEFMSQLKKHLRKLPFDEVKEVVDYYEQYFDDAGAENEQLVLKELGSPFAVASQIITSFAAKDEGDGAKMGFLTTWRVILAVFSSRIALIIALPVAILAFALALAMAGVIFAIGAAGVVLALRGITSVITSIPVAWQSLPTALFFFGLGLSSCGIGLAVIIGTVKLSKISFNSLAKNMGKFILRRNKK